MHSKADYDFAVQASEILFNNETADILASLSEKQLLQALEGVPTITISKSQIENGYDLLNFLTETSIFPSKSEARKMWQNGGIRINKKKIETDYVQITKQDLLQNKYLLIQKGKKNYYLAVVND